jgi:hypothetical protein
MSASERVHPPNGMNSGGDPDARPGPADEFHPIRMMLGAGASPILGERPLMLTAWPIRSVLAGTAGTATMTLAYAAERRLRPGVRGQLDYDDSLVPGQIVATVMHLPHVTGCEDRDLGLILRWSYGSAFGLLHGALRRVMPEPWASAAFGGTLMTATLTLFPVLGRTPPPWRWPADVIATSFGTHVAYVAAVATADDGLRFHKR